MASVTGAPNGAEGLVTEGRRAAGVELAGECLRGVRSNVEGHPAIDLVAGVEGFPGYAEATVTCDGDPSETAFALERLASTLLATAHDLRRKRRGGHETTYVLLHHALLPTCACGQPAGHPDGAFS